MTKQAIARAPSPRDHRGNYQGTQATFYIGAGTLWHVKILVLSCCSIQSIIHCCPNQTNIILTHQITELITAAHKPLLIDARWVPHNYLSSNWQRGGGELGVQTLGWVGQSVQTYRGTKGPHTPSPSLFFLARNLLAQSLPKTISYPQLLNQQQPKKVQIEWLPWIYVYHDSLAMCW